MIIRDATPDDAAAMAALLNRIIAIGGTTAHETAKTPQTIRHDYIDGPHTRTCVVAEDEGRILGFQAVDTTHGEAHIGTFVDPDTQAKGIGAQMFARTRQLCTDAGIPELFAAIRADNVPGLAYYARIGFADIGHEPDYALSTGAIVGRVHRKLSLR
ncbi:GNAT family N-acetyltransferase [Pseudorhodobacter sp. MZDSW-24AT]|uniref:GNAT family N-acetyltransferase n=1 Tax=Pseudorhodobacter sp. MZDSW-24AT TaxID=2052957 RepID=UPI000C1F52FC|nr:GNAT family N-acetyltransferase [Pseudorhodobacter sp. MZDSW-24AT]PJF09725.1 GNAT family N-acetyltransferase [Pseudorhodobacter sp. MZDSW-24AT]